MEKRWEAREFDALGEPSSPYCACQKTLDNDRGLTKVRV